MLNKKSIKILSIVVMIMMLLVTMGNVAFAEPISLNPKLPTSDTVESLQGTVEQILGIIQWAGIIAAVVIAMFVGIKYITAAPDGKAEIKKTLGFYIAGMVLLLSASAIVTAIQNALS